MNLEWTNSLIDDIIDKIHENMIVPIIGPGSFYVPSTPNISVQQYAVQSIIENSRIDTSVFDDDDRTALGKGDFRSMTILKKILGKDLRVRLKEFYKKAAASHSICLRKEVCEFLRYGQFPLILTTCNFRFWDDLYNGGFKYEVVSYKEEQNTSQDIVLNDGVLRSPTIFHLLGYVGLDNHVVITENDFLRYLHGYHDINSYPKNLKEYLRDKFVLSLGCEIPDWTVRFLLYSLKENDILQETGSGSDSFDGGFLSINLDRGLSKFLRRISYFTHTNVSGFLDDINNRLTPERKPKIFLSLHSEEYVEIGSEVKEQLRGAYDAVVYSDFATPQYWEAIEKRMADCDYFMPVVTPKALNKLLLTKQLQPGTRSTDTKDVLPGLITEWMMAVETNKKCIPVCMDVLPDNLKNALQEKDPDKQIIWPLFYPKEGNQSIYVKDVSDITPNTISAYTV